MSTRKAARAAEPGQCPWPGTDAEMQRYHDEEWGVPVHDDRRHFEFLILDAFQAGLSWRTILHKRPGFRAAFADFDPQRVARFGPSDVARLLQDAGIVRNRLKIESAITNARQFLEVQRNHGSFDAFIWRFVGGIPTLNRWRGLRELPARTEASDQMSRALRDLGFRFVGSTICYAYMQAAGMVNDHLVTCRRYDVIRRMGQP